MRIRFRTVNVVVAAVSVLATSACSGEPGEAVPTNSSRPEETTTSQTNPADNESQLAEVDACDLLTDEEAATISKGLKSEDLGAFAGATSDCEWTTSVDRGVPIEKGITFGISIRPSQSVDEVSVRGQAKVTNGDVEGRTAKLVAENDGGEGSCLLSFAVEQGRVDIIAESYNTDQSCTAVDDVSTIIEQKLPEQRGG